VAAALVAIVAVVVVAWWQLPCNIVAAACSAEWNWLKKSTRGGSGGGGNGGSGSGGGSCHATWSQQHAAQNGTGWGKTINQRWQRQWWQWWCGGSCHATLLQQHAAQNGTGWEKPKNNQLEVAAAVVAMVAV